MNRYICNMTLCLKNSQALSGLLSSLSQRCPDMLRHIFEYDGTYKERFQKDVIPDIWKASFRNWHANLLCPYKYLVADWLLTTWCVYDSPMFDGLANDLFRKYYHSSDIVIMTRFVDTVNNNDNFFTYTDDYEEILGEEDNYKCIVQVYMKNTGSTSVIFAGEILTQKQYTADCQQENHYFENKILVHSNLETGLCVYQRM